MKILHNPKSIFIFCYALATIISVIALIQLYCFLYENIYKTVYNSDQILILRSMVAMDQVDMAAFRQVIEALENKSRPCYK